MSQPTCLLLVRTPGGHVNEYVLRSEVTTIGRATTCDLVLDGQFVSRTHAAFELRDGRPLVRDLDSRNGVLVNGRAISDGHRLVEGDKVTIGGYEITVGLAAPEFVSTRVLRPAIAESSGHSLFVDSQSWEVWVDGTKIQRRLSVQEFTFMKLLYERPGKVCSRAELGDAIWGAGQYDLNLLYRLVHRVKDKVEPDRKNPCFIESVVGVGYKITTGTGLGTSKQ